VQETATYEEYRAAGHDHDTAAALVGIAAICTTRAEALEKLGPKGRDRVAKAYEEHGRKLDADPQVREERERGGRALAAMAASLAAGEPPEVAQERAKQAGGQARFDYTERADELRREAFAAHGFPATRGAYQGDRTSLGSDCALPCLSMGRSGTVTPPATSPDARARTGTRRSPGTSPATGRSTAASRATAGW
jgi:hypothetical protein